MIFKIMSESDIEKLIPMYLEEYNGFQGDEWTFDIAYARLHQIWSIENSYCIVAENDGVIVGFVVGWIKTFYDIKTYHLEEIVVLHKLQGKGLGTLIMKELENRLKDLGVSMITLDAVNDEMHEHFYGKLQYKNVSNFVSKVKNLN